MWSTYLQGLSAHINWCLVQLRFVMAINFRVHKVYNGFKSLTKQPMLFIYQLKTIQSDNRYKQIITSHQYVKNVCNNFECKNCANIHKGYPTVVKNMVATRLNVQVHITTHHSFTTYRTCKYLSHINLLVRSRAKITRQNWQIVFWLHLTDDSDYAKLQLWKWYWHHI